MGIAFHLFVCVLAFVVHAILPFVPVDPELDRESTAEFLAERNAWIETAKTTVSFTGRTSFATSDEIRLV